MNKAFLKVAGAAVVISALSGCASKAMETPMATQSELQQAMSMAQEANAAAAAAQARADEAMSMASSANATAAEAKGMAMATDERINRMFKSSMMK